MTISARTTFWFFLQLLCLQQWQGVETDKKDSDVDPFVRTFNTVEEEIASVDCDWWVEIFQLFYHILYSMCCQSESTKWSRELFRTDVLVWVFYTVLPRLKPHGIISETGFGGPNISRFGYYPSGALSETPSGIISETGIAVFIGDSMVCPAYANFAKWKPDHFLVFFAKIST